MSLPKITVIGSYAVGMTIQCNTFPTPGQTVEGSQFQLMHGGKGSNQAVACRKIGADVEFATCVGNDSFGQMCYDLMHQYDIATTHLRKNQDGVATGVGLVSVDQSGENEIIIDLAANYTFGPQDVDAMEDTIANSQIVLMQLEMTVETVAYVAQKAKALGTTVVLNTAPYKPLPDSLLAQVDYLILNETEGRDLAGLPANAACDHEAVADLILARGVSHVIMTLGADGALLASKEGKQMIPVTPVNVVDTTGAGDTFCGAFCVALAENRDSVEAIRFANMAAGITVEQYGIVDAIPTRQMLDAKAISGGD